MSGIVGSPVRTFREANLANTVDISLNGDYPHFFFDVVKADSKLVTLKSFNGEVMEDMPIRKYYPSFMGKKYDSIEYVTIEQSSSFEKMMGKPSKFKITPIKGKRT